VEVRQVREDEFVQAGRVTALAYSEFAPPGDQDWIEYLGEIADIGRRASKALVLVAVEEGRVLGSATVELDRPLDDEGFRTLEEGAAHLRMLGVDPSARRRGAARALVKGSLEAARTRGKHLMTLHTTTKMIGAQRLYESMGFERDPGNDHRFDSGFVLIAYRRSIESP
jgi:ribosomal protein S18 acetylase RimI-like enzyme